MSYKKIDGQWVGFCDGCEKPLQPNYLATKLEIKNDRRIVGFCKTCSKRGKELVGLCMILQKNKGVPAHPIEKAEFIIRVLNLMERVVEDGFMRAVFEGMARKKKLKKWYGGRQANRKVV